LAIILTNKRWFYSLRFKFFLSFTAVSFVTLIAFFLTIRISVRDYYLNDRKDALLTSANIIAGNVANYIDQLDDSLAWRLFDLELDNKSTENDFRIIVFNAKYMVLNDTNKIAIGNTYVVPEVIEAINRNDTVSIHSNEHERSIYAAAAIVDENAQRVGALLVVASIDDIDTALDAIERTLLLYTALMSFGILAVVFFLSKLLVDPIHNISSVVTKMAEGNLRQRIAVNSHDEFAELAEAFNLMTEKLDAIEKTREEFVSNVSHELKTPLSSIKVLTESILLQENVPTEMYNEFLQDINSEIDRMTYIVLDLLDLVKLDQGEDGLRIRPMDLNKMAEDILKRLFPLAEQKGIELLYEDVRKVIIDADEMKLGLAVSNLVENGIKYTLEGGIVKLIVDGDHQNAFITVQDTGIGIAEDDHDKVFNRFYRVDKTRDRETGGTGLGLAITRATVLLHNGSIRVVSKEDEGTTFIVRIPLHYRT